MVDVADGAPHDLLSLLAGAALHSRLEHDLERAELLQRFVVSAGPAPTLLLGRLNSLGDAASTDCAVATAVAALAANASIRRSSSA